MRVRRDRRASDARDATTTAATRRARDRDRSGDRARRDDSRRRAIRRGARRARATDDDDDGDADAGAVRNFFSQFGPVMEVRDARGARGARSTTRGGGARVFGIARGRPGKQCGNSSRARRRSRGRLTIFRARKTGAGDARPAQPSKPRIRVHHVFNGMIPRSKCCKTDTTTCSVSAWR